MRVLVTTASKHGSTAEIGSAIAETLADHGIETGVLAPDDVISVHRYDAVIMGSAVYAGHWMSSMKRMAHRLAPELTERPVWLFSSGPVGDPPLPEEEPVDVAPMMEATGARGHVVFAGKLDKRVLTFAEKAIVAAFKVSEGDFRDWDEVRKWTAGVAEELASLSEAHSSAPAG
jgi:menaquinone-dependent protoporphyrinogen oxidase